MDVLNNMYLKAILAVLVSAAGALVVALGTGNTDFSDISASSWLIAALTVLGSGGLVWLTENGPAAPAIKAVIAFLTAGIGSAVLALDDNHITHAEWLTAITAAVVATGFVYQATNKTP
jgi:FtsH-binding integral membrane protein